MTFNNSIFSDYAFNNIVNQEALALYVGIRVSLECQGCDMVAPIVVLNLCKLLHGQNGNRIITFSTINSESLLKIQLSLI